MRLGITGARGVLGRITTRLAQAQGHDTHPFEGDIRDRAACAAFAALPLDAVLHYAARVPVAQVQADPDSAFAVNAGGTRTLLDALAASGRAPWVFYAGTCHVYAPKDAPLAEDDPIEPISLYGRTKLEGERACADYASRLPICIGRIFSYWHDSQQPPFLYPSIKRRLAEEDLTQPFALHGADSRRDFLNAEEVCALVLRLMERRSTGTFNIASGKATAIRDFVQAMAPRPLDIRAQGGAEMLVADIARLTRELTP